MLIIHLGALLDRGRRTVDRGILLLIIIHSYTVIIIISNIYLTVEMSASPHLPGHQANRPAVLSLRSLLYHSTFPAAHCVRSLAGSMGLPSTIYHLPSTIYHLPSKMAIQLEQILLSLRQSQDLMADQI